MNNVVDETVSINCQLISKRKDKKLAGLTHLVEDVEISGDSVYNNEVSPADEYIVEKITGYVDIEAKLYYHVWWY